MAKKPRGLYKVHFGTKYCETWAVSEKQAVNNAKYQLGLAGTYDFYEYVPTKIELVYIKEN